MEEHMTQLKCNLNLLPVESDLQGLLNNFNREIVHINIIKSFEVFTEESYVNQIFKSANVSKP